MTHDDNITFTINQVAKMLGVVSATIRNWEKNGLITVKRSPSNYRIFTLDDIENLKKIKEYSVDMHLGTQAIRMLQPTPESGDDVTAYVEAQKETVYSRRLISEKWKEIRRQQGYTLEEVASAVGISPAQLSNLEHGSNISLDTMNKLAHFYGESPLYFMTPSPQETHLVKKGKGEEIRINSNPGINMTSLVAMTDHVMYPIMCTVEPGEGNTIPHSHNGEEMVYVISGTLEYRLNDDPPYILHAGDTFYYKGSDLHSWKNISSKPAKLLWVHSALSK